jgi:hypothetical protein
MSYILRYPRHKLYIIGALSGQFYMTSKTKENGPAIKTLVAELLMGDDILFLNPKVPPYWESVISISWKPEVLNWFQSNKIPVPKYVNQLSQEDYLCLEFDCESHAMMFKLRWFDWL